MKKSSIGSISSKELLDLRIDLDQKLAKEVISIEEVKLFLKRQNPFALPSEKLEVWQKFYLKYFGKEIDFSRVQIPKKPKGNNWRLIVIAGLGTELLFQTAKKRFDCWKWTEESLDEAVLTNERDPNTIYAIWVKDNVEADEENRNLSANDIKAKELTTETLAERITHEMIYFDETGNHLDIQNFTLCSGSRRSDGGGPGAGWYGGEFSVRWYYSDSSHSDLRGRAVVS